MSRLRSDHRRWEDYPHGRTYGIGKDSPQLDRNRDFRLKFTVVAHSGYIEGDEDVTTPSSSLIGNATGMKSRIRPLGVKFITAYFFARAAVLALAVAVAFMMPEMRAEVNEFISKLIPIILRLHAVDSGFLIAPLFAIGYAVVGFGVWNLQKWARTVVVLNLLYVLASTGFALAIVAAINHRVLESHPVSPYFIVDVLAGVLTLGCLLDPDVKRAFNVKLDEFE